MPRGGSREGTAGQAYGNRSDLNQPARAARGQVYGERQRQEEAQQAVPLPRQRPVPRQRPGSAIPPGSLTPLTAPSERPDEAVTTGMAMGEGAGPEALSVMGAPNREMMVLKQLLHQFPNEDLRRLVARAEARHIAIAEPPRERPRRLDRGPKPIGEDPGLVDPVTRNAAALVEQGPPSLAGEGAEDSSSPEAIEGTRAAPEAPISTEAP